MIDAVAGCSGVRVLHLIDPPEAVPVRGRPGPRACSELDAALCAAVIASTPQLDHEVLILGTDRAERWARAFGLPCESRVGVGPGVGRGRPAVRRFVRARSSFDALQAWSERTSHAIQGIPRAIGHATVAREMGGHCVIRSSDSGDANSLARSSFRDRLGVDPRDRLVGLVSWSGVPTDAAKGRWVCSLASTMGERSTLVMSDRSTGITRAMRMGEQINDRVGLVVLDGPVLPLIGLFDAALCVDLPSSPEDLARAEALAHATRGTPLAVGFRVDASRSCESGSVELDVHSATRAGAPSLGEALARALADSEGSRDRGGGAPACVSAQCAHRMLTLWQGMSTTGGDRAREGAA